MAVSIRSSTLAAALAVALAPAASAQEFINILTGGTSGVYYPLGVALSEVYAGGIAGARVQVQSTKASVENLNLLQQGRGELAFSLGDSVAVMDSGRIVHTGSMAALAADEALQTRLLGLSLEAHQ